MARKRVIDTTGLYFDTELVELLGERGLHLYIRLWCIAEDWGGYEPKYADIALQMGAFKFTAKETEKYIKLLVDRKKIIEFENGGRLVHWIVNFMEHQPLNNPSLPKLNLPEWITFETKEFKSGKKYAIFTVITERIPVGYSSATSKSETETKQTRNRLETETILSGKPDYAAPILYLNEKAKTKFDPKNKANMELIRARYAEGRTLEQFKIVVDKKISQWLGDEKMQMYLRPSTLFNRTNFENYVNEPEKKPKTGAERWITRS